jgi:hypothetical protein
MKYATVFSFLVLTSAMLSVASYARAKDRPQPRSLQPRYGIAVDLETYPQSEPRETIRSVIRATQANNVEYLLAQLIAPKEVDAKFQGDPEKLRLLAAAATPDKSKRMIADLKRHLDEGAWVIRPDRAWSRVQGVADLSLERTEGRWFMNNSPQTARSLP